jgi:hypothetical protein
MDKPRYWFRAKRYGWGWGLPLTWEGWVVLVVWLSAFLSVVRSLRGPQHRVEHVLFVIGMIMALLIVCYWKGEPGRWRWGD